MTKDRLAKALKEYKIGERSFYTIYGICEKIEGRTRGSHLSINQMLVYVSEGAPCFEHQGRLLFEKDLNVFTDWLRQRRPTRQQKALQRQMKLRGFL